MLYCYSFSYKCFGCLPVSTIWFENTEGGGIIVLDDCDKPDAIFQSERKINMTIQDAKGHALLKAKDAILKIGDEVVRNKATYKEIISKWTEGKKKITVLR